MFGRFSTALQNAVDVLAPSPPLHEDFAYHWKKLMNHYLDVTRNRNVAIELTNIPSRFDQLLKILIKEDEEMGPVGRTGPCLEYLLHHNLLDLLATLATSDDPPGMRQHVFQFVNKFLTSIKTPVLGHASVFQPLQRLVGLCDGTTPGPSESHEVQFLLGLTAMIRRNPHLVPVFMTNGDGSDASPHRRNSGSSDGTSCRSSSCVSELSGTGSIPPQNNPLFTPLATSVRCKSVRLVGQPDSSPKETETSSSSSDDNKSLVVDDSAQFPLVDAAISYMQSPDCRVRVKACQVVMLIVSLPDVRAAEIVVSDTLLISRLVSRLGDLYHNIPHSVEPGAIDDMHVSWGLDMTSDSLNVEGSRQLASFLSWYDFVDQVLAEAHPSVGHALVKQVQECFLGEVFTVDSLSHPVSITLLAKCFKLASSSLLNQGLAEWLVGKNPVKETSSSKTSESVLHYFLNNWSSPRCDLALETLRLFEVILDKGNHHILNALIFIYLKDERFLDNSVSDDEDNSGSCEGLSKIERILNSFVNLVPVGVRSSDSGGYEQYLAESQRQFSTVLASTNTSPTVRPERSSRPAETDRRELFYEGPFLRSLFNSLSNIPNQPYEVNLELTGIVSKVCLRPEPPVSRYLIESSVERFVPEATTLQSVLHRVANVLSSAVMSTPNYENTLKQTRQRLVTDPSQEPVIQDTWSSTFENIVVVEELCKELAAIAYVKHKSQHCVLSNHQIIDF